MYLVKWKWLIIWDEGSRSLDGLVWLGQSDNWPIKSIPCIFEYSRCSATTHLGPPSMRDDLYVTRTPPSDHSSSSLRGERSIHTSRAFNHACILARLGQEKKMEQQAFDHQKIIHTTSRGSTAMSSSCLYTSAENPVHKCIIMHIITWVVWIEN